MTLHGAKGLEFDTVFLPGWEEGVFPHSRALSEDGGKGLEEERRLAYVGITRARKRARIFYAANRRIYNKWQDCLPSRFIAELPEAHIDHVSATGYAQPRWSAPRAVTWTAPAQPVAESDFRPGERVFHTKFGPGTVKAVEGDRLDIHFDHAGPKKVLASFVEKP